jgi:D-amino-acid oxidase
MLNSTRAGVAGLTTALLLSKNKNYKITVAAKHMPGDYDIEYASPWAGANYMRMFVGSTELARDADANAAVSTKGSPEAEWDRNTWLVLNDLARNHPDSGIHFQGKAAFTADTG